MAKKKTPKIQNGGRIENSLLDCLGGGVGIGGGINALGFPYNQGGPNQAAVLRSSPMFTNIRWDLVSNYRQMLSQAYVVIGLVKTLVDVPVDDGLRGGIELKSSQLSEDQIHELQVSIKRDNDIGTAGQAAKWNRLFGGAGILILTDQDPMEELDLDSIGQDSELEFRAVDMWELFWDKQNTEGYDPEIQTEDFEFYNYYGEKVHKSRVLRLKGLTAPSFIRPRLRGWGFSMVEILVGSINQYYKAINVSYEVMDEFKIDVYRVKNLVNTLLSPNGNQAVMKRFQTTNLIKNYQNAIVLDMEDEYAQKQLSFAGLAETMQQIRMQVAADMRMPITKLFGQSVSGGLGNTDQNDIENYNAMIEAEVRNKLEFDILRMCEIKCQKLFGMIPDDLALEFKPLRELTAIDQETVKTSKLERLLKAQAIGAIPTDKFIEACNKGNLFDVVLEPEAVELLDPNAVASAEEGDQGDPSKPSASKDVDDPGANREDSRKPRAWEKGGAGKAPQTKNPSAGKKEIQ